MGATETLDFGATEKENKQTHLKENKQTRHTAPPIRDEATGRLKPTTVKYDAESGALKIS